VPHRSLPPCGGGTGRGVAMERRVARVGPRTDSANRIVGSRDETTAVRV